MATKPATETKAEARLRLAEEIRNLGFMIDREPAGSPERLEMLRRQASLSDQREALSSVRH
jgi:hypothetical protein